MVQVFALGNKNVKLKPKIIFVGVEKDYSVIYLHNQLNVLAPFFWYSLKCTHYALLMNKVQYVHHFSSFTTNLKKDQAFVIFNKLFSEETVNECLEN